MRKQCNTNWTTMTQEQVPTIVCTFFNARMWHIINIIRSVLHSEISGSAKSEIGACFKLEIEHENPHRNKAKIKPLNPTADQLLRKVVVKCSVCW